MELLGLKTCDTCRKALKELQTAGHEVRLRDVRAEPLTTPEITALEARFGEALLNRKSTTWRGLSEAERARSAADLLAEHPALMKRPVVMDGDRVTLGWAGEARGQWLG